MGVVRLLVGGAGLLVVAVVHEREAWPPRRRWSPAVALGALGVVAYQPTFFLGTERAGVAVGTVVAIGSAPVAGGVLGWVVQHQVPRRAWTAGTAIAVAGIALLVLRDGVVRLDAVGLLASVAAGVSYAIYALASARLVGAGCPPSTAMALVFGTGAVVLSPWLLIDGAGWITEPAGLAVAAHLGLVTVTLAYVLFARGVGRLPLGVVMTVSLAEPAVAAVLGVVVLGESLGAAGVAGLALVLTGVAVATRP